MAWTCPPNGARQYPPDGPEVDTTGQTKSWSPEDHTAMMGLTWDEASKSAKDRKKWKDRVEGTKRQKMYTVSQI
jgi:hypothetical protein